METRKVSDLVLTSSGEARPITGSAIAMPTAGGIPDPTSGHPVRIAAGALAKSGAQWRWTTGELALDSQFWADMTGHVGAAPQWSRVATLLAN